MVFAVNIYVIRQVMLFFRANCYTYLQILAMVEFNPDGLPEGWVKEIIFRKCNDGIRKDPVHYNIACDSFDIICWHMGTH